ncbi:MAG: response regulator [Acidobacteria bacterium]|nr:response regulator [Acidobacteriota bacterium]
MKKILIIDDDADFVEINRTVLEAAGFAVKHAYSGKDGVAAALADPPDLVILDLMMEHWDSGFVAARRIKGDPATAGVPVLMLTGVTRETGMSFDLDSPGEREWIKADMFLSKPLRPEELLQRVKAVLGLA